MNNNDLLIFINFIANKEQSGNTLKPSLYQNVLQRATTEYFEKLLGKYEIDQKESNSIKRFKVTDSTIHLTSGVGSLPSDYEYVSGTTMKYLINGKPIKYKKVDLLSDKEWDTRIASTIEYPTMRNPIAKLVGSTLVVSPNTIQIIFLSYLKTPATPTYVYSLDANDNVVYDTVNSVELDFNEHDKIKIAGLILSYIGVNLKEADLAQYGKLIENEN